MNARNIRYALPIAVILLAPAVHVARQRTSVATLRPGQLGDESPRIWVKAGPVHVIHSTAGTARIRATVLEGRDSSTSGLTYTWADNGEYTVDVSGRYQHKVLGAVVGTDRLSRITSRVTYEELPDSARH